MNDEQLLSIIMPVFNGELFIEKNLRLLLENDYNNFEVLLCDDDSKDDTWKILQKFQTDSRVKLFQFKHNIGPGAARNFLMSKCSGEFIAIQDADDTSSKDRFIKQVNFLNRHPDIDVVGTSANLVGSNGEKWGSANIVAHPGVLAWYSQRSVVHASIMFRRKLINTFFYAEDMRFGEDYYFLTSLYLKNIKISNIEESLYNYIIDRADLKDRSRKNFSNILASKYKISKLFNLIQRIIFLILNFSILIISSLRAKKF
jgi:glycosyltransferase involved in cell wall biosynthesis